jgi:hypothetical protein
MRDWANSFALCFVMSTVFLAYSPAPAATTSSIVTAIVTDPLTGVALDGYDVVSYFTEETPSLGVPAFEYMWGGVPWYFATAANRDVFVKSPDTYAPMFGGYGAIALSRGYLSAGNPRVYLVLGERLFVFYSSGNREAFLVAPRKAFGDAERQWKELSPGLTHE